MCTNRPATVFIHRRLCADGSAVGPPGLNLLPSDEEEYQDPHEEDSEEEEDEDEEEVLSTTAVVCEIRQR